MYEAVQMFFLALVIGLTGALAPGPTLVATINASLVGGWTADPKVLLGHMAAELAIFVLIFLGMSSPLLPYAPIVAVIGGMVLLLFGLLPLSGSRPATPALPGS